MKLELGKTYICTYTDRRWWTVGKEYTAVSYILNSPVLIADDGDMWSTKSLSGSNTQFKLKPSTKDLEAELIYWKETAEGYQDRCYDLEQDNDYLRNQLNKTLDK